MGTSPIPAREKQSSSQAQPNDFVEHLRTIHFTLLIASTGLLVIVLSPYPLVNRIAEDQMRLVLSVQNNWKAGRLGDAARTLASSPGCQKPPVDTYYASLDGSTVALDLPRENWTVSLSPGILAPGTTYDSLPQPQSLSQFRAVWDSHPKLLCPELLGNGILTRGGRAPDLPLKQGQPTPEATHVRVSITYVPVEDESPLTTSLYGTHRNTTVFYSGSWNTASRYVLSASYLLTYDINFRTEMMNSVSKKDWYDLDFKDAFRELDQVTTGFQDLDFEHLKSVMRLQTTKAQENFEAFGIRFPIEATTRWGVLIILAIQMYFWIHLKQYRKRKVGESEIAWIGSYGETLPRLVFFATAILVPIGVVLVSLNMGLISNRWTNGIVAGVTVAISARLAGLTAKEFSMMHSST